MQQFIPFEDDWDALEKMRPDALIPYRVGYVPVHEAGQVGQADIPSKTPVCLPDAVK